MGGVLPYILLACCFVGLPAALALLALPWYGQFSNVGAHNAATPRGDMARAGEREKEDNWSEAIRRARLAGRDESRV
eukprot:COSAG01_NODE_26515_length_711_cov_3.893791_1_plen_76_part_10